MEGVFVTKEFERVYRRSNSTLKNRLSKWVNTLCGTGITKKSFPDSIFVLIDTQDGLTVIVVIKNRFSIIVNDVGNTESIDKQCFIMSSRLKQLFSNLKIQEKGLFKSTTLEKELDKAFTSNEFKHIPRSTMVKYCSYNNEEQV